jgi:hypothetical protein
MFCAEKYSRQLIELCLRYIYYDGTLFIHSLLCLPLCFFLHLISSFCLTSLFTSILFPFILFSFYFFLILSIFLLRIPNSSLFSCNMNFVVDTKA